MPRKKVKPTANLEAIAGRIRESFSAKDQAREKGLRLCREVIRYSSQAIRSLHRREFTQAKDLLSSTRKLLGEIDRTLADHGDLLYSNFVHDAQKEFAEGNIALAIITTQPIPTPEALGVSYAAYLNGMGEAVGELRRYLLDCARQGNLAAGEELLAAMDDIYSVLVTMDFPEGITGGLRRTTDNVRGILEKTRGDITIASRQQELETSLEALRAKLNKNPL